MPGRQSKPQATPRADAGWRSLRTVRPITEIENASITRQVRSFLGPLARDRVRANPQHLANAASRARVPQVTKRRAQMRTVTRTAENWPSATANRETKDRVRRLASLSTGQKLRRGGEPLPRPHERL